jgi:hypothetical protein
MILSTLQCIVLCSCPGRKRGSYIPRSSIGFPSLRFRRSVATRWKMRLFLLPCNDRRRRTGIESSWGNTILLQMQARTSPFRETHVTNCTSRGQTANKENRRFIESIYQDPNTNQYELYWKSWGTRKNHTWAVQRADGCEKGVDWTQYSPTELGYVVVLLVPDILATYVSSGPSLPGTSYRSKVSVTFCAKQRYEIPCICCFRSKASAQVWSTCDRSVLFH